MQRLRGCAAVVLLAVLLSSAAGQAASGAQLSQRLGSAELRKTVHRHRAGRSALDGGEAGSSPDIPSTSAKALAYVKEACPEDGVITELRALVETNLRPWAARERWEAEWYTRMASGGEAKAVIRIRNGNVVDDAHAVNLHQGLNVPYIQTLQRMAPHLPDTALALNWQDEPSRNHSHSAIPGFPVFGYCQDGTTPEAPDLLLPYGWLALEARWSQCSPRVDATCNRRDGPTRAGPHDKRMPVAVGRNSIRGSGGQYKGRTYIWRVSKEHPDKVDAGIAAPTDRQDRENMEQLGMMPYVVGELSARRQQDEFRYTIHVPGNCAAVRLASLVHGDMLVFKIASNETEWYYPLLKPWKHYVPVHFDPATQTGDLLEKVEWANAHPHEVHDMVEAARHLASRAITEQASGCYTVLLLDAYAALLRLKAPELLKE